MKRYLGKAGALIAALVVLFSSQTAFAQQSAQASSSGLSIAPRKNYTVKPGEEVKDKLTIGNLNGKVPLYVTLKVVDFTFRDESGTPRLILDEAKERTSWSLKPFMNIPETVQIEAGKTKTIDFSIKVPANQGAGSYYSAIQYSSSPSEGGNVNLSASGVTLAFLSIPGTVKEDMKLEKFGAFQRNEGGGVDGRYLKIAMDSSPSIIAFTLKNNGNVAESPAGNIIIKDMFGNEVKNIDEINPNGSLALIGQSRRFEACMNPKERKVDLQGQASKTVSCESISLKPGRYTASLAAYYGQNGNETHEIVATSSFWYLPYWFLAIVLLVILLIVYIVWRIKRKLSRVSSDKKKSRLWRRS